MKFYAFLLLAFFGLAAFSQTTFQPGYFISNSGERIDCLIKNQDWKDNPKEFEYKMTENDGVQLGKIAAVKEFGVPAKFKYVRATVQLDRSGDRPDDFSSNRNPIFKEEQLFLKTLIEGKASLFLFEDNNLRRFFYKMDDGEIEQLVYKRYLVSRSEIGKNERYKQQLSVDMQCEALNLEDFEKLEYNKNRLMKLFQKFNTCKNSENIIFKNSTDRQWFNFTVRPGVQYTSLSVSSSINKTQLDFGQNTGFRLGFEAEFVLPFRNNKWTLFAEPSYYSYEGEKEVLYVDFPTIQKTTIVSAQYDVIEISAGLRHYFYLNNDATIFINGAVSIDHLLTADIDSSDEDSYDLDIKSGVGTNFGVGFRYKNKYSFEARYMPAKNILQNYFYLNSNLNSFALILGYNFL